MKNDFLQRRYQKNALKKEIKQYKESCNKKKYYEQIEQINQISKIARTNWIALTLYLSFICITLFSIKDKSFFLPTETMTILPLIGVSVDAKLFILFAPMVAVALYIYLHIYLTKLWEEIAKLPKDKLLAGAENNLFPWLVNDFVLRRFGNEPVKSLPMANLSWLVTYVFIFFSTPIVVYAYWYRTVFARDIWYVIVVGFVYLLTIYAFRVSRKSLRKAVKTSSFYIQSLGRVILYILVIVSFIFVILGAVATYFVGDYLSFVYDKTDNYPIENLAKKIEKDTVYQLSKKISKYFITNLDYVEFVPKPTYWQRYDEAKNSYKKTWCDKQIFDKTVCKIALNTKKSIASEEALALAIKQRQTACDTLQDTVKKCGNLDDFLSNIAIHFETDWRKFRSAQLSRFKNVTLKSNRLNFVTLTGAFWPSANFSGFSFVGSKMPFLEIENGNLDNTYLFGVSLIEADLRDVQLNSANLIGSELVGIDLSGAEMSHTQLHGTVLNQAKFIKTNFFKAIFRDSIINGADFKGANLIGANLLSADLRYSDFFNVDLRNADFRNTNLFLTNFTNADLRDTDFRSSDIQFAKNLTQQQLQNTVADEKTKYPKENAPDTGNPYYLLTCLKKSSGFDQGDKYCKPCEKSQKINAINKDIIERVICGKDLYQ